MLERSGGPKNARAVLPAPRGRSSCSKAAEEEVVEEEEEGASVAIRRQTAAQADQVAWSEGSVDT